MKKGLIVAALLFYLPLVLNGQESTGTIKGAIKGPQGAAVPYLWIRALDSDDQEHARDESDPEGAYALTGLPAGTYTLEIITPCCAFRDFESETISVGAGADIEFVVNLEEGMSFNTVGDDPGVIAAAIRGDAVIPDDPPPQTPDGKPDLSGIWLVGSDPFPDPVDAQDWAQKLLDERVANSFAEHPHTNCLPGDPPIGGGAAPFITKFVQTPELLAMLMEDYPGFRQVFMDGRKHPRVSQPELDGAFHRPLGRRYAGH